METIKKIVLLTIIGINSLTASVPMLLRLDVSGNSMQNETVVYFDANGSFTYNSLVDAPSLGTTPGYLNIVTHFDSIDYQIKCLPLLTQNMSIPLKITTGIYGTYQISANDIQNLPAGACISLHDNFTNTDRDLRLSNYSCTISDTESVVRFTLQISISLITVSGNFMDPTCKSSGNGYISASGPTGNAPWNFYWKDSMNNIIKTSLLKNTADTLSGLNAGAYRVDITTSGMCTNGSFDFYLQATHTPVALYSCIDTCSFTAEVLFANSSTNASTYFWDFGDGIGTNDVNASHYYAGPGTYQVSLLAIGSVCTDSSVYLKKITIVNETTGSAQLTEKNNLFISRDEIGYYVQFDQSTKKDALISITDMLGKKIMSDVEIRDVKSEKRYLDIPVPENRILIVSVFLTTGEKIHQKIIY